MISLVKRFIELYPEIWEKMDSINHSYCGKAQYPNKHHLEGSISAHTLLVIISATNLNLVKMDNKLALILLLHDVGKAFCYEDKETLKKRSFKGHNIKSFEMAGEIIETLDKELSFDLTPKDKETILTVIKFHDFFIECSFDEAKRVFSKEVVYYLCICNYCDNLGRVSNKEVNVDYKKKLELMEKGIAYFEN